MAQGKPGSPVPPAPARVWRAMGLGVAALLVANLVASYASARIGMAVPAGSERTALDVGLALVWIGLASLVVGRVCGRIRAERDRRPAHEQRAWNMAVNLAAGLGYLYVALVALALLRIDLSGLLVGGAVTGIVLGIAAQSALGNLFGGMLVLLLHPYSVGQRIMVRSSMFGGTEYAGTVVEVTLFYTVLNADTGRLVIPNSLAVASVVRVDPPGQWRTALLALPYRVGLSALREGLRGAGLPEQVKVEAYLTDSYSVRVRLPDSGGDDALVGVLQSLLGAAEA